MPNAKLKGRYFFGVDSATSIVPQAGVGAGNLTYTAGGGGATFASNYVDLRTGSRFTTPFTSVPRNRTIIIVGMIPFKDEVYDSGVYRFPPITLPAAQMSAIGDLMVAWDAGFLGFSGGVLFRPGAEPDILAGTYDTAHAAFAYRDSAANLSGVTLMPQIFVLGHGAATTDNYLGITGGRKMAWLAPGGALGGAAGASVATNFGHVTFGGGAGGTALAHVPLLAYAEYSWMTKAEALTDVTEMVGLLEGRGWTSTFLNPMTSE